MKKKIYLCLWLFGILNISTAQSIQDISIDNLNSPQDKIVNTPFGPALKSNVHYLDNDHYINNTNNNIQVIQKATDKITKEFYNVNNSVKTDFKIQSQDNSSYSISYFKDGWITYADGQFFSQNPLSKFSTNWIVPQPPKKVSNQLLYIFIGGGGTFYSGYSYIIQPVLQWGISPAGGGNYWSICNWFVINNEFFHDSLLLVQPGTSLNGIIRLTSFSDSSFSYNSSFGGYPTSLQVDNIPELINLYIAFEAYSVQECIEYPVDEKVKFCDIQILTGVHTDFMWTPVNWVSDCGQFTEVISNSNNGEIDIHFHKATVIDNFEDIQFYPNPVEKLLHISPREPISNCKIEIHNNSGRLIWNKFFNCLDYEVNINLEDYPNGIYLLRFSYNNVSHAFKIIKVITI